MSKTSLKTTVEWNNVQWRKLERRVFKLQKRIYRASERGDVKAVRRLQPNSYGFRPGRSCHDAIQQIFTELALTSKYVLDADIAKCFDKINHHVLLNKVNTFPTLKKQLRAWLKSGVMDNGVFEETSAGTPRGAGCRESGTSGFEDESEG